MKQITIVITLLMTMLIVFSCTNPQAENTEKEVSLGNSVAVEYTGSFENGEIFDSSQGRQPLTFEVGSGMVISGFDEAVLGMNVGEEKTVVIPPEKGYGSYDPQLVQEVPITDFPPDQEIKEGMSFMVQDQQGGQLQVFVKEVTNETVTLDLNHPLAGKTLHFKIKVLDIY